MLMTEESSRYCPRLPIAIPFPPWQVIYHFSLVGRILAYSICDFILYILDIDIVRTRFESYTIIPSLVDHVGKPDIVRIHRVKSISVLNPVHTIRRIDSSGIGEDVIEPHIRAIHDIE